MSSLQLRRSLFAGVSTVALVAAAAVVAPGAASAQDLTGPSSTYLSLEGGAACPFGDTFEILGEELLNDGCGWTGRIGFGQRDTPIVGMFDGWGLFVRHTRFPTNSTSDVVPGYSDAVADANQQRTVVDFEVGQDIGIGSGAAQTRWIAGLRYADHRTAVNLAASYIGYSLSLGNENWGVGPRIGLETHAPFSTNMGLVLAGSASALYGQHTQTFTVSYGILTSSASASENGWMLNAEGEAGIYWQPSAAGNSEFVLGLRAEFWRDTSDLAEFNRHNWGPFLRYNMSLGGS